MRWAKLLLVTIPTRQAGRGETEVAYEHKQLDSLLTELTKQQTAAQASQGIQHTKLVYKQA